jgi:hypothetical protein
MNKKIYLMVLFMCGLVCGLVFVSASSYSVCESGCNFDNINDAISNSEDGDIINVLSGLYDGFNVSKSLNMISENAKIVGESPVVIISADNVVLNGFSITSTDNKSIGIKIEGAKNYSFSENSINGSIIYGMGNSYSGLMTGMAISGDSDHVKTIWVSMIVIVLICLVVGLYFLDKRKKNL